MCRCIREREFDCAGERLETKRERERKREREKRERERGNACYCFHENTLGEEFDLNSLSAGPKARNK